MKNLSKLLVLVSLVLFTINSYAIDVSLHSSSKNIQGLGFKVDGKKHGGRGMAYEAKDLPNGQYSFGVRKNGKNIPCSIDGKKTVELTKNTHAVLSLKGNRCTAVVKE